MRRVEKVAVVARHPARKVLAAAVSGLALFAAGAAVGWALRSPDAAGKLPAIPSSAPAASMPMQGSGLSVPAVVEAGANERLRRTVKSLRDELGALQEQLRFYQRLVAPSEAQDGLRIERWAVAPAEEPGQLDFTLLLTQHVDRHEWIEGTLQVSVAGEREGAAETLPLRQLVVAGDPAETFRFLYFQDFSGRLTLPQGFAPSRVAVVARLSDAADAPIRRSFEWREEES